MKNISTGFGLCVLGLGIAAWPVLDRLVPSANASAVTATVAAVSTAATAQATPTIVWYGIAHSPLNSSPVGSTFGYTIFARAWSDGKLEMKKVCSGNSCSDAITDLAGWVVVSNPASGLSFDADLNFDEAVDGADLSMMLAKWGPAPRNPVLPSDCPLALINP